MFLTTIRGLLAHKFRLLATALAVMLGVAFMSGTLVLSDTITKTFNDLFTDVYSGTSAVVRGEAQFSAGATMGGEQRGRLDSSLVDKVAAVPGVKVAQGDTFGYAQLVDKKGEPFGNPQNGPPTIGANWGDDPDLNHFHVVEGTPPRADDEIVIDRKTAKDTGYKVGDTVTVLVQGPPQKMRVAGIAKFAGADSPGGAIFVMFTTSAAQRLVAQPGKVDTISVLADNGISQNEIVKRIEQVLPRGTEAITGKAMTKETQDNVGKVMSVFTNFMLVFALVALFVGAFIIYNTFFITVAQRTKENALLRAVGASRRQVLGSVLLEALAVGILASVIGLFAGVAVAAGLEALLKATGMLTVYGGVVFASRTVVVSLIAGIVVTVIAAIAPARKAAKVPPVAAMRDVAVGSTGYGSKERVIVGVGILAAGVALLFYGLFGDVGNAFQIIGLGALLVFFAVSVLGRTIALPVSRVLGWPVGHLRGVTGMLGHENAMRNPKRTAATASALMIGVGLVGFITIFASSSKASINATLDREFTGDIIVNSSAAFGFGGIDPALAKKLETVPEVGVVTSARAGLVQIFGATKQVVGVDPEKGLDLFKVGIVKGSPERLKSPYAIAVYKKVAEKKGLDIGDVVPVTFKDTGKTMMTVGLIYKEHQPAGDYLLPIQAYEANFADQYDMQIYVKKAPGVSTDAALSAVKNVAKGYPGAKVLDQNQFKEEQAKPIDQMLGLVYALLALAIIIALLGIANTLALSIIERTRELGVLRAVGMTRSQLRSMIRWEAIIIAVQGTLLGLVVGLFFGWALVAALKDWGITTLSIPVMQLTVIVLLGALAGIIAAVLPARRAAKLDVLRAVVTE